MPILCDTPAVDFTYDGGDVGGVLGDGVCDGSTGVSVFPITGANANVTGSSLPVTLARTGTSGAVGNAEGSMDTVPPVTLDDSARPVVVSVSPASEAVNVGLADSVIIIFSESMATGSLTSSNFGDFWHDTPVVIYNNPDWDITNKIATFTHDPFTPNISIPNFIWLGVTDASPALNPFYSTVTSGSVDGESFSCVDCYFWSFTIGSNSDAGGRGGGVTIFTPVVNVKNSNPSVLINSGALKTFSSSVVLSLYSADAKDMKISNNASFDGASWERYTQTKTWILILGSGARTVYVKFRNKDLTESAVVSDGINLENLITPSASGSSAGKVPVPTSYVPKNINSITTSSATFSGQEIKSITVNLSLGSEGVAVKVLQQFLIDQNKGPSARALAENGVNAKFGILTKMALIEWQKVAGISPAIGTFGSKTRAYISTHSF